MSDVTQVLQQIEYGDSSAAEHLLPLVYDELRKLAAARMANESPDHTLQATALVHEAYVRLVDNDRAHRWDSRGHFFAAAAEAMRRILVESARRKSSLKHGGGQLRVESIDHVQLDSGHPESLLALDEALERLAAEEPLKAQLVKLRCFAGLSHQQAAETLGLSRTTADRYWACAKTRLYCELFEQTTE